jgi:large subunit ribosomal protein L39
LFSKEKERQRNAIGRIEKIEVQYKGVPEDVTLLMNKHLSTPFECAKRQSQI